MFVSPETLELPSLFIPHDIQALVARHTIMKDSSKDRDSHWAIRNDLWILPASFSRPIDGQHMICESLAKCVFLRPGGLALRELIPCNLSLTSLERTIPFCVMGRDRILR